MMTPPHVPAGESRGRRPCSELVLAIVSDEEAGGDFGAKFLAQEQPNALAESAMRWASRQRRRLRGRHRLLPDPGGEKQL